MTFDRDLRGNEARSTRSEDRIKIIPPHNHGPTTFHQQRLANFFFSNIVIGQKIKKKAAQGKEDFFFDLTQPNDKIDINK